MVSGFPNCSYSIFPKVHASEVEAKRYHKTEVPVFTGSGSVSIRDWSRFKQEVLPFGNRNTSVSNRKYFRLETGVLLFQTGSTPVWKQEYYRFKQVVLRFGNKITTVLNGSTLDRDKKGTECQNQLEWVKFFLFGRFLKKNVLCSKIGALETVRITFGLILVETGPVLF